MEDAILELREPQPSTMIVPEADDEVDDADVNFRDADRILLVVVFDPPSTMFRR